MTNPEITLEPLDTETPAQDATPESSESPPEQQTQEPTQDDGDDIDPSLTQMVAEMVNAGGDDDEEARTTEPAGTEETEEESSDDEQEPALAERPEVAALIKEREEQVRASLQAEQDQARAAFEQEAQERAYQQNRQRAGQFSITQTQHRLNQIIQESLQSGQDVTPQQVAELAGFAAAATNQYFHDATVGDMAGWLAQVDPNYQVPQQLADQMRRSQATYDTRAQVNTFGQAVWDMAWKAFQAHQDQQDKEASASDQEADLEKRRAAAAARQGQPRPTQVSGGSAPVRSARAILDDDMADDMSLKKSFAQEYGIDLPI
jgi:hypothetical protein